MKDENFLPPLPADFSQKTTNKRLLPLSLVILLSSAFVISVGFYNFNYLTASNATNMLTLSHRGVSDKNGVQNTIAALKKTATTTQPDYIEMDIQETRDQQFVVMHDPNLKNLAGVNKRPQELTLAQLKKMTIKENGKQAKIATFNDYLAAANRLHQKLLIEIKVSKLDSPQLVKNFIKRYQKNILSHHHLVQSLDYQTVQDVKTQAPKITTGYILPFNIVGPPKTKADFLTMEYSTINKNFIDAAKKDNKQVFVWTPNDIDTMSRMNFYGANGIITDRMDILNQVITDTHRTSYANKLMNFVIGIG